jgi:hypothetical protein
MTQSIDLTQGGGASAVTVPAATSGFVIKAKRGRLCAVLVTEDFATTPLVFTDDLGTGLGTVLAVVPATATAGTVIRPQMIAQYGIYAVGGSGQAACTVSFN